MTGRQRQLDTLLFRQPDRIPLVPGGGRQSTREAWYRQGLPRDVKDIPQYAYRQAGGKLDWPTGGPGFITAERMIPMFEEKVIERKERSQIVQDWKGNICEIGNEFTTEYLRNALDFVTRRWVKCPVENAANWEEMKRRYDPNTPERLPADAATLGPSLANREHYIAINFSGPFWQLREWCGFEPLCVMLYDNRPLVMKMLTFWEEYVSQLLERTFRCFIPDEVHLSEDMAYKSFSMISPAMTRELLLPMYKRWGAMVRKAGVPIYAMDSDGYVGELIPMWLEAGINVCDPIEVAAGNDIVAFRKEFGKDMAYRGGVDKRAIAKGGDAILEEMRRIEPVISGGGCIPSCDHGVPSDVSWPNYVRFTGLLAKATGWL